MASGKSKSGSRVRGSELARRRKALEVAAQRVAADRLKAREAEEARQRREGELDELVADFELARQDEEAIAAEVEAEVARVRERGRERARAVRVELARVVVAMGAKDETVQGCARRLGVGVERVKELRRLAREAEAAAVEAGSGAGRAEVVQDGGARRAETVGAGVRFGRPVEPGAAAG